MVTKTNTNTKTTTTKAATTTTKVAAAAAAATATKVAAAAATKVAATKTVAAKATNTTSKVNVINKEKAIEAINAVIKYSEIKKNAQPLNILDDDNENLFVSIETDKYYHDVQFKPYHITVPHQIYDLSSKRSLIIIQGNKEQAMDLKTKITEMGFTGLFDVTSMKQFKKDYITPELKIKLTKQYEEFIVDSRFKQKIQHNFGKEIYLSKQSPKKVEVDLNNPVKIIETLNKLNRLVLIRSFSKLLFTLPIGNFELGVEKLIENLSVILDEIYSKLPEKLQSIQSLAIKASDIRLPFYVNVKVPEGLIFDQKKQEVSLTKEALEELARKQMEMDSDDDFEDFEDFEDDEEEEEEEQKPITTNKKRATPEPVKKTEEKQSTPNKKVKTTPVKVAEKPTPAAKESTPVKQTTTKESTPVKQVKDAPAVKSTPAKQVKETPVKQVKETPVKQVKETPVKQVKETPVKQVKETPVVKATPVKTTPVKKTPAKK
ncbi:hypothetical protein DICPUDRAFT_155951 [Dictyostelium purpureum]|uniref:Ribosomal protein L1 n=1 Tax=Dictyostelium purpureum TaxID=5786 RepID=F0ZVB3_DICPU|nr:uncharacterized protein DICPUDRAFT_155951 [Dictyostelium purpureum]EGC32114.1 hypothetical protein DICPUDRAFT_155951 [Dictyostelium purpureum]|eukprot:XP_003291364.1 hypothetical protein DICPUDRAFT_155951 [Dictyostelium purpureum]